MRTVALYEMLYGLIMLALAIAGAVAGSMISLAIGGPAGLILIVGGLMMQTGKKPALWVCLVVTLALLGRFGYQIIQEFAIYPDGIISFLSLISLVLLVLMLLQPAERKRIY
jgi:uncharacterized membrane protein (UPF0136 family)